MRIFTGIFAVFIFVAFIAAVILALQFLNSSTGSISEDVVYEVIPGQSFKLVAQQLQDQGLITSALKFRIYAKLTGRASQLRRGEYALNKGLHPREILDVLTSGKSIARPFTVPEGSNIFDIAEAYETKGFGNRHDFLQAVRDPQLIQILLLEKHPSFEGYLYPETYLLTKFTTAQDLVTQMVKNFLKIYGEIASTQKVKWSRHQLVTLASIVEKETGAPEERPLIASIFYNRLKAGMRLQSDPTILYGILALTGEMKSNITKADILKPTIYNTYTVAALPYGPIANPGREALLAVANPATSSYLYFVSRNDGTHVFSSTYQEHVNNVRKFQLDPKAREGKSWRDLKKRVR